MTATTAPQSLKLNYKDRDYDISELPRTAQLLLQDMVRLDQQISQLQFELRHLQAARQIYSSSLLKSMNEEEASGATAGGNGHSAENIQANGEGEHAG
jgi:iron uptake system EfeUOB component EfeO/EfeM